jgi:hypothetical protein
VVALHPVTGELHSGQLPADPGFAHWLLKFDGVGLDHELGTGGHCGRIEYAYHLMARSAGIDMPDCRLLEENGWAHFMIQRFDRDAASDKLHMQTLCAMDHLDYNQRGTHDYAQLFQVIDRLRLGPAARAKAFRRMVFNVVAANCDDHTKNHSFLMDRAGQWRIASSCQTPKRCCAKWPNLCGSGRCLPNRLVCLRRRHGGPSGTSWRSGERGVYVLPGHQLDRDVFIRPDSITTFQVAASCNRPETAGRSARLQHCPLCLHHQRHGRFGIAAEAGEVQEAMRHGRKLPQRRRYTRCLQLAGIGHTVVVQQVVTRHDDQRGGQLPVVGRQCGRDTPVQRIAGGSEVMAMKRGAVGRRQDQGPG